MRDDTVTIGMWVLAQKGCPVRYTGHDDGYATFLVGEPPGDFELSFDPGILREFLRLGAQAVRDLEAP